MPRSSRHRSHKERKHSSKDARDYSDSEDDVRMKEKDTREAEGSDKFSRELTSGEKRKKDGQISSGNGGAVAGEEFVSSKRRKEKADGSNGGDRWDGRGDSLPVDKELKAASSRLDSDKGSKESKVSGDFRSKSSRRVDGSADKKENSLNVVVEKDDNKSAGRVDSRRKSDKDSTRRESKDKERGSEKERKVQDAKRDADTRAADGEVGRKQRSQVVDVGDCLPGKGGRENTEWSTQDDSQNPVLEQDLERRIQRRSDGYLDKDKFQDDARGSDEKRLSSRSDQAKDGKHKDERHKDRSRGDQYREDGEKDGRRRDDKARDDVEKDRRHRDVKYREDGEKYYRHRDDKKRDDGDKDTKRRDDKYHEDVGRDNRHRDDRYREDSDRDHKYNNNKYLEDGDRHHKYSDKYWEDGDVDHRQRNKYLEDGDREKGHSNDRYSEDAKSDDRHQEDKYKEDGSRDNRYKEEKNREELDRDGRYWDISQGDDVDREKRLRDTRYREERSSRDRNNDKSDAKRARDESNAADYYRKSSNRDDSPSYDKRGIRYKEDQGKRKAIDTEDHVENRSRSSKEERADIEKKSISSAKIDGVPDRGRSSARHVDMELNSSHVRLRDSPSSSSYAAKDHYRLSKQEEPRYRDYAHEEKAGHNIISIREYGGPSGENEKARLVERHIHKDDGYFGELSAEKRLNSDVRASPLQVVDKSPSSTSTERRLFNRSDVRRSFDIEDSAKRSGSFRDAKEARGSRELPMDTVPMDEFSLGDGDNIYVSSPFPRGSHYSGNSRSRLPPPPFRIGADSQSVFGSSEDDNRVKSGNRHRRTGDPNMGRVHGNSWKGVPNWTSPMANGFMPFQHGPPPVNFHPMMQQFPAPPIFGVRPPLDLNHTGVPYHMPDADRFSGHVRPLGWRNSVDDSCPPLNPWESSNAVFGDESHPYGRLDWDHSRTLLSSRGRESSVEVWKGQNSGNKADLPSTPHKEAHIAHAPCNEMWTTQFGQQAHNEQNQSDHQGGNVDFNQLSDTSERKTLEAPKTTIGEAPNLSELKKRDASICQIYLSKLDISVDLAQPELYDECKSLQNLNQNEIFDDYDDESKILYVEGVIEAKATIAQKNSNASLFAPVSDAVYQKAISLYKKQREEFNVNGKNVQFSCLEKLDFTPTSGPVGLGSSDGKEGELVPVSNCEEIEVTVSDNHEKGEGAINIQMEEEFSAIRHQKSDDVGERVEKLDEAIPILNMVKLVEDKISNEKREHIVEEKQELFVEEKLIPKEIAENSDAQLSHVVGEDANMFSDSGGNCSTSAKNDLKFLETKSGRKSSDVFSEACEGVIVESNESKSVNLSRIHHSPESTH